MGITGLLKGLQGVTEKRNVRDFANQSLAIDASSWLHKSVYSISRDYVEALARDPTGADPKCVRTATRYVIRRCQELLTHANIGQLYLVLDGQRCPLKVVTNDSREERRQQNLKEARQFIRQGQHKKAEEKYKTCIKINAAMATQVIEAVTQHFAATRVSGSRGRTTNTNRNRNNDRVICIKSPYEADSQLVKLCIDGLTHAIVTEDSDVLVYLAACQVSYPILFKLDRNNGECDVISTDWLLSPSSSLLRNENNNNASQYEPHSSKRNRKTKKKKETTGGMTSILQSFSTRQQRHPGMGSRLFVQACVLTGCDYAPSQLNGVGLVTAFKLIRDHAHRSCEGRFQHVLASLKQKITLPSWEKEKDSISKSSILQQYEELLAKSEAVFYHHPVLQVSNQKIAFLTPRPPLSSATASTLPKQGNRNQEQDNNKSLYNPSLSRFQENLSFLGTVQDATTIMANDDIIIGSNSSSQPENDTIVPVPEIIIQQKHHTLSCTTNNNVHKASQQNNRRKRPAKPIANPYKKQFQSEKGTWLTSKHAGKRKEQEQQHLTRTIETSLPFSNIAINHQSLSPAEKTSKRQQQEKQPLPSSPPTNNIFSQFQYSPTDKNKEQDESEKENQYPPSPQQEQTKNDLSMYQYKKGRDVRFVKPKFSKQGGRSKPKKYFIASVKTATAAIATRNIKRPQKEEEEEVKGDETEEFFRLPQQPPIDQVDECPPKHPPLTPPGKKGQAPGVERNSLNGSKFFDKSSFSTNTGMYLQDGVETYLTRKVKKGEVQTDKDINPANERLNSHLPQDVAAHQDGHCSHDEDSSISRAGYKKSSLDRTIESQEYRNTNHMIRDIDKQLRDTLSEVYQSDPIGEGVIHNTHNHHIINIDNQYTNDEMKKAHPGEAVVNDPPKDDYTYFKQCDKTGAATRSVTETSSSSSSSSVSSEVAVVDSSYDENDFVLKQQAKHNRLHYVLGDDDSNSINSNGNDCIKGATEKPDLAVTTNEDSCAFDDDPSSPVQSKYWGSSGTKQRSKARRVARSPQKSSSPTLDAFRAIGGGNHQSSEDEIGSFGEEAPQPDAAAAQPKPNVGTYCWDMSSQRSTKNQNKKYGSHLSNTVRSSLDAAGEHHQHDHDHINKDEEEIMEALDTETCNASFEGFSSTNRFSQSSGGSRNSRKTPFQLSQASSLRSYHSKDSKQHQPKKSGPIHKFFRKHQHHQPCKSKSTSPSSSSSSFFSRQNATKHRITKKSSSRHKRNNIAGYFPTLPWKSTNPRDDDSF